MTEGDGNLGVKGNGFEILFSYTEGGPVSLRMGGAEWLWRAPRPSVWRAATDNDRGCGFPQRSAAWLAADTLAKAGKPEILEQSAQKVVLRYTFALPAVPGTEAVLTYTVTDRGALEVEAVYHGAAGAPELPCFGVTFQTAAPVAATAGPVFRAKPTPTGTRAPNSAAMRKCRTSKPHLVPQECGLHLQTRRAVLQQRDARGPYHRGPGIAELRRTVCLPGAAQHRPGTGSGPNTSASCRTPAAPA